MSDLGCHGGNQGRECVMVAKKSAGSQRTQALERARQRRVQLDADRLAREKNVDEAVADFLVVGEREAALREAEKRRVAAHKAALVALDADRAAAVARLLGLGEAEPRVAELLEIDKKDVRRLKRIHTTTTTPTTDEPPAEPAASAP